MVPSTILGSIRFWPPQKFSETWESVPSCNQAKWNDVNPRNKSGFCTCYDNRPRLFNISIKYPNEYLHNVHTSVIRFDEMHSVEKALIPKAYTNTTASACFVSSKCLL